MTHITFLGLGVMGAPMARHLVKAGHSVTVYNRTVEKAEAWAKEYGGAFAATPFEAVQNADIVCACLGDDNSLYGVCLGENGAFAGMKADSIFVDHTTASAECARKLYSEAKALNISFLDAPVSGGQAGAENGQLSIMMGGNEAAFQTVEPVLKAYAKACKYMGASGAGQLTKMVNQICIAGLVQGLSEGLHFTQKAGLDPALVLEAISQGAASSWQMVNRWPTMAAGEFNLGFAVDHMRKDLNIVLGEARNNGAQLPITAVIDQFYAELQAMQGNRWDTSSLVKRLK